MTTTTDRESTFTVVDADVYLGEGVWRHGAVHVADGVIRSFSPDPSDLPSGCRTVDADGASLLPGFIDAHVHPEHGGAGMLGADLTPVHDVDAYLRIIREHAAAHPDDPVIVGDGWYGDLFDGGMPTAEILDSAGESVAARPVVIDGHDGHGVWVNTAALRAAGITAETPDPDDGRIVRDADGSPTGTLLDGAMQLVAHLTPARTADSVAQALLAAQRRLHSVGVTAWADAMVGVTETHPDPFDTYLDLYDSGLLTGRVSLGLWWQRTEGIEQIDLFRQRRDLVAALGHPERLRASTVKIMQDGMVENLTGAMVDPYVGSCGCGGGTGPSFNSPVRLAEAAAALDAEGFDLHFHGCGDRAVRECLDAVEYARASGQRPPTVDRRHQIAHVDVVHPDDMTRFADLDVTANLQMLWARRDTEMLERKLPQLGAEREAWQFPFGGLHRAGARLAAGSDWPVSDPNPLWAIHTGVSRTAPAADVHAVGGQAHTVALERQHGLDFTTALDAYLTGSAWVNRLDGVAGRIAPGTAADLVVLDAPLRRVPDVSTVGVVETFVGGVSVWRR
ncbi:N-substituted formamide deformylase [Corynebacterium provencense]|uniref:N-substituted formamide deformylase n=1 Tax=Corynebacterium provencense TaxID=1737425 RepID=A0A2Z3YUD8_9CORY|nr:amidohydrolase [Corynebacterium provencense]AWT25083.1 N-substituted formamide deformylase [Corynebacterium provencense]